MGRCGVLGALVSWMAGAGSLGCVAAALRHSVAVRGRRRLCACAPVWHTLGAGLVLLSGVLYVLYDVLLLVLCWLCVRALACAGAMVAWYQSSACDDGPARLCALWRWDFG